MLSGFQYHQFHSFIIRGNIFGKDLQKGIIIFGPPKKKCGTLKNNKLKKTQLIL